MKQETRKKMYIILSISLVVAVIISIGYSVLSSTLTISYNSVQQTNVSWDVGFVIPSPNTVTPETISVNNNTTGISCGTATVSKTSISIADIKLSKPGDVCKYTFTIANTGDINAKLKTFLNRTIMAYMSKEGYEKLRADIKKLEEIDRPEVIRQIQEAREKGDLSENAEYDAAKEAQGKLETKIAQLKAQLADAKIIDTSKLTTDSVQILSKVELKNVKTGMKMAYTIVSEGEANLRESKISIKTPIAQGLLGKKVGDVALITIPQGTIELEVLSISM